jgi:hypothetical protein
MYIYKMEAWTKKAVASRQPNITPRTTWFNGPKQKELDGGPTKRMLWSRSCWVHTREMINVSGAEGTAMSGNCRHSGTGRLCISKILSWQSVSETMVGKKEKRHASSPQSIARKFPLNFQICFVSCGDRV